ncbi:MAG: TRAP transporter small permease [Deltaproteobacteria bacterium]|nr:TRAP transporter small permease [Deltaproteobacteria bacterium]
MTTLDRLLEELERVLKWICVALVVGLSVLVFLSVFLRYLFNSPLEWADEVVGFFILGLTYFGSAVACGRRSQIYVELLESFLKKKPGALRWVRVLTDGVVMIALVLMVLVGLQLCVDCRTQKTGILMLSYFWVYMIMPVGVAFMLLMMVKRLKFDLQRGFVTDNSAAH